MKHKPRLELSKNTHRFLRFTILVLVVMELSMGLYYVLLQPPQPAFIFMFVVLSMVAVIALIVVYLAFRLGWVCRSKRLDQTLLLSQGITMAIIIISIGVIAKVMFADVNDVVLTGILLLFDTGIVMAFSYMLAQTLTDRIQELSNAAAEIAQGNLAMRVPVTGNDELSTLGNTFNDMTIQLDLMDRRQRDVRKSRNELLVWVGHDLRTPLTSLRAILEALADQVVDDPETQQRYLRTAQSEVQYLSRLIDDLFDLSQMETGGLKLDCHPNSLSDLISEVIENFTEVAFRQGIILEGCVEPGLDPVWMDGKLIGRVLTNLTSNALRYTPPGGTVQILAHRAGKRVQVEIIDNGDGIKGEDLPFIFERFYRGEKSRSRETGGTGLGLAISRAIVEAHQGQIRAESTENVGTRMIFTLPDQDPEEEG